MNNKKQKEKKLDVGTLPAELEGVEVFVVLKKQNAVTGQHFNHRVLCFWNIGHALFQNFSQFI